VAVTPRSLPIVTDLGPVNEHESRKLIPLLNNIQIRNNSGRPKSRPERIWADNTHIYNRCGDFVGINHSARNTLLTKIYKLINVLPITLVCSGIDKYKLHSYHNLLRYVWTFLVERFDMYISESRGNMLDRGMVLSDKSSYESKIVKLFCELIKYGSKFQAISNLISTSIC
jgi:hypothetical protein